MFSNRKKENRILFFIKYAPLVIILMFNFFISFFLYFNHNELFNYYYKELIFFSIFIFFVSLYSSFFITNFLEKSLLKYVNALIEEKEKNKRKDFLLFQQSKLSTIGELLGNIVHQWRQPLNVITITASGIKMQKELGIIDNKKEIELLEKIMNNINYLCQTVDDFRDFYTPHAPKSNFLISTCIDKCLKIINSQFSNNNVSIKKEIEDFKINGFENQLMQILINLFNNSIDKFEESEIKDRIIKIKTFHNNSDFFISIMDNAGGINENILTKIFEPYFTTKENKKGTGIGLYMSLQIIQKSFNGIILAKNTQFEYLNKNYLGALFEIKLPKLQNSE